MEPTDNLSLGRDYACPAGTFNQLEQEEDLMSSLFMLSDSPPPSLCLLSLPLAEGFARTENFGDHLCIPAAVAEEETNYAAARAAPLVATHGTDAGQFSFSFSLSSTTCDNFDEEEVQQKVMSFQHCLRPPMAPEGLSNTTNGGPAARNHADAGPPVAQQGTCTTADELPHPQQQLSLTTNDSEAQPGDGCAWLDLSMADEVQIQQTTPTISPSQPPPSPTPVINPGLDEANHAASAPMGSQAGTLIPAAPQDQEANIPSRTLTRRRPIKSGGRPQQNATGNFFRMGMAMLQQFVRHIGEMLKEEKKRSIQVWPHFCRSQRKCCGTVIVICQYCDTVMIYTSTIEMSSHLESCYNYIKETQRPSRVLQIKEITENPNGESEPIETDNSNRATAALVVDTQGTNAVALSPWQQQLIETFFSSQPCCPRPDLTFKRWWWRRGPTREHVEYDPLDKPDSWWHLIIQLSESWTTKSTDDGFRLKFSNKEFSEKEGGYEARAADDGLRVIRTSKRRCKGCKLVHVDSSAAAWVHVSKNTAWSPYEGHAGVLLEPGSDTIGSSYLSVGVYHCHWPSLLAGCSCPWKSLDFVLQSLGFKEEFARNLVIYALRWVDECNLRLSRPRSMDKGKSIIIVEQGDVSSGKRRRKSAPPRSKVWKHFKKLEGEEAGSTVTMAKCNHCGSKLRAGSKSHGTSQLKRHIKSIHPEHAKSL